MKVLIKYVTNAVLYLQKGIRINKLRSFSLSYNNIPANLQNRLELYCQDRMKEFNKLMVSIDQNSTNKILIDKYNSLKPVVEIIADIELLKSDSEDLQNLLKDSQDESDILDIIKVEEGQRSLMKDNLYNKLIKRITAVDDLDEISEVSFEILCGAGGQESMLFAEELSTAYLKYVAKQNWSMDKEYCNFNDQGGIRSCKYIIYGEAVYSHLKYESGIHRVQRVPSTSPQGKIHTSTAAVIVLPWVKDSDIEVPESHLKWDSFKSSGPGGQHVNTTDSAVRVTHIPTGLSVCCQAERLQQSNKKQALDQLIKTLNERQYEEKLQRINSNRRVTIGSRGRSEKIRTYNYQQDRVTDHRVHRSWSNVVQIMNQGNLEEIISTLHELDFIDQLENALNNVDVDLENRN